jgi:hypothetical protein
VVRSQRASLKSKTPVVVDATSLRLNQRGIARLNQDVQAVSCYKGKFCMVVGASGHVAMTADTIIQRQLTADGPHNLIGVSCASAALCVIIDNAGSFLVWDGSQMSGANPLYNGGTTTRATLTSVSCPTALFCMVIDANGDAFSIRPPAPPLVTTLPPWSSGAGHHGVVSCNSETACVVADANGNGYAWDGKSWSKPQLIEAPFKVDSISCPPTYAVCFAVDHAGYVWSVRPPVTSGGQWSVKKRPGRTKYANLTFRTISCASDIYCLVSDGTGGFSQVIGGTVGPPVVLSTRVQVVGPSCSSGGTPSVTMCAAEKKPKPKDNPPRSTNVEIIVVPG